MYHFERGSLEMQEGHVHFVRDAVAASGTHIPRTEVSCLPPKLECVRGIETERYTESGLGDQLSPTTSKS